MKLKMYLMLCFLFVENISIGQDLIVLKNGDVIKAKIVSVENDKITYRDYGEQQGASLVIFTPDVLSVAYENGEKIVFEKNQQYLQVDNNEIVDQTNNTKRSEQVSIKGIDGNIVISSSIAFHFGDEFQFRCQADIGTFLKSFGDVPLFATGGVGYCGGSYDDYGTNQLFIPVQLGYMIGEAKSFHLVVRGGAAWSYLLSMKYKNNKIDLSDYKRSSWFGIVRVGIGQSDLQIYGEYDFSFNSDNSGLWLIGLSFGL